MSHRKVGRVREKLAEHLLKCLGIVVSAEDLWCQEGGYRRHKWDLACWGSNHCRWDIERAKLYNYHGEFHIASWDTMTASIKKSVGLVSDPFRERLSIEVST